MSIGVVRASSVSDDEDSRPFGTRHRVPIGRPHGLSSRATARLKLSSANRANLQPAYTSVRRRKSDSASRPAFSAAASFGISVNTGFPFGLPQAITQAGPV